MKFYAVFLPAILIAFGAFADESRIPISAPVPTSTTIVINTPGTYVLTRNITSNASPVISVLASPVRIDLNGRTITNNGAGNTMMLNDTTDVVIVNGFLLGGQNGIFRPSFCCGRLTVESVTIADTTSNAVKVAAMTSTAIRSSRIVNTNTAATDLSAIFINGGTGHIADNEIIGTTRTGIFLASGVKSAQINNNIVRQYNTIASSSDSGIRVEAANSQVDHNTIEGSGAGSCIALAEKGALAGSNNVSGCTYGFVVTSRADFIHNNVIRGHAYGIFLIGPEASENLLDDNQIQGNTSCALYCDQGTNNAYRNNMMKGNTSVICGAGFIDGGGNIQ
jgi:hypothetical protein